MVSTPSRSRQAMTISLPFMAGPTSGRRAEADFLADSMVLLMLFMGCGGPSWVATKKPTTVASRGFLSKSSLASTSPGGIAGNYDRDYQDLLNVFNHCGDCSTRRERVKH